MMRLIDDHTRPDRNITCINTPTNDTWARDFGPISVYGPDGAYAVDFIFNGWGDKFPSAKDNDVNHRLDTLPAGSLWSGFKSIPFVLEEDRWRPMAKAPSSPHRAVCSPRHAIRQ